MSFRLSSIDLSTQFDDPVELLDVPSVADRGDAPALCMLDGANRSSRRLARLVRKVALLGLRLDNRGRDVRFTIRFLVDDRSTAMWGREHLDDLGEPVLEEELGKHRLLEVTAQGRSRALGLLRREPGEPLARSQVQFDLTAEEIADSGVVMVGFEVPRTVPAWAEADLLEDGVVGVSVRSVRVEPITSEPLPAAVSGGERARRRVLVKAHPGFFVVNPGSPRGPVDLLLSPASGGPPVGAAGPASGLVQPRRRIGRLGPRVSHQPPTSPEAHVEAVGHSGVPLLSTTVPLGESDRYVVRLPVLDEPAYLRARVLLPGSNEPRAMDWLVRARAGSDLQD